MDVSLGQSLLLLGTVATTLLLLPGLKNKWVYRHIPGPFNLPFIGNLLPISKMGLHMYMLQCRKKYGKTFKVYLGSQMMLVTCDPEVARRVNYKMINRNIGGQLRLEDQDDIINTQGLVVAKGDVWRTLRLAWQPAFQSGSLEGYCQLMDDSAHQLAQRLSKMGDSGEVVELWRELGRMTLHVVGSTAYGVDFHTLPHHTTPEAAAEGAALMQACQTVFSASSITKGSVYLLLNAMFPLPGLIGWMARKMPDGRLLELMQARRTIRAVSQNLIASWRAAHPVAITAHATTTSSPALAPAGDGDVAAAGTPSPLKEAPLVETISATVDTATTAAPTTSSTTTVDAIDPSGSRDQAGTAGGDLPAAGDSAGDSAAGGSAAKLSGVGVKQVKAAAAGGGDGVRRAAGLGISPGSFMGLMLSARDKASGHSLTDTAVVAQANTFTLAGYETTANTLAYCVYNIARHPAVQERLLAEVDAYGWDRRVAYADMAQFPYAEAVVREALRLYPPATLINREVKEGGFDISPQIHIPAGATLLSFMYGYQRDPEYWPAAEEFRPERWLPEGAALAPTTPDAWTPFGTGARMCVGWRFALQEAKIALVRLYQNQTYQLEPGQVPLALQQNLTLSPKHGVFVRVIPRT